MDFFVDAVRVLLLFVAFTLAMLCLKFAWVGHRQKAPVRVWGALAVVLLLITPAATTMLRFGEPFLRGTYVYAAALACGVVAMRKMFTVYPEWTRFRLAAERERAVAALTEERDEQDVLRADDRVSQAGERADSREMYDAGHLHESEATYDRRVEAREDQDANREHSHQLQDDERDAVRADEDDRL